MSYRCLQGLSEEKRSCFRSGLPLWLSRHLTGFAQRSAHVFRSWLRVLRSFSEAEPDYSEVSPKLARLCPKLLRNWPGLLWALTSEASVSSKFIDDDPVSSSPEVSSGSKSMIRKSSSLTSETTDCSSLSGNVRSESSSPEVNSGSTAKMRDSSPSTSEATGSSPLSEDESVSSSPDVSLSSAAKILYSSPSISETVSSSWTSDFTAETFISANPFPFSERKRLSTPPCNVDPLNP